MTGESLNKTDVSQAVARQAVDWLLEIQEGPLQGQRQVAWQQWLNGNAEHQRAWAQIQRVNQRLSGLSSPLAHAALNAPRSSRRQALKLLLLLGMGSVAGWSLREHVDLQPLFADFDSGVGERRRWALDDGSGLHLNTASAVDVRFDAGQRLIRLLRGEILVTAADDLRPLRLTTAEGLIQAEPGASRFNLRQREGRTQLAVFSGSLRLSPHDRKGSGLLLRASQQVAFDRKDWGGIAALDAGSGAWADGMLVASRMRLADFLDELGRYRRGRLQCDADVAELLISGSYPLADSERILDMLERALPVKVQRFTRYWVSVQARTGSV
ncbi:FecR domain-containing protein [Pseudomonas sp. JDS28PS106]|uniref:FecR domain-containing protein n=1 Tax=Pseudomonas sp. JDS28PS106 TaxID=2497235 RepID=UPI003FA78640